jgi:hypothetical protein
MIGREVERLREFFVRSKHLGRDVLVDRSPESQIHISVTINGWARGDERTVSHACLGLPVEMCKIDHHIGRGSRQQMRWIRHGDPDPMTEKRGWGGALHWVP